MAVLATAMAGAIYQVIRKSGKYQAEINPVLPRG